MGTESCRTIREVRNLVLHCCDAGLCIPATVPICMKVPRDRDAVLLPEDRAGLDVLNAA